MTMEINQVVRVCNELSDLEKRFKYDNALELMSEIFGLSISGHLFNKWREYKHDFMKWYSYLDNDNRRKIAKYIISEIASYE